MLKTVYSDKKDIPEIYVNLFSPCGDVWVLKSIEGVKTHADIFRLKRALEHEKKAHFKTKNKLYI